MNPARSPRFQVPAERVNAAVISACGSPRETLGAEHAAAIIARHNNARIATSSSRGRHNVPCRMADATPHRWKSVVYGPVASRRLGRSLGLNILPRHSKLCEFDCPYCSCGFTTLRASDARWSSPDEVAAALLRALERLSAAPDWICFSGNGEPTLHPRFAVVVDRVLAIRAVHAPAVKVAVMSNGCSAGRPVIRDALRRLDAR